MAMVFVLMLTMKVAMVRVTVWEMRSGMLVIRGEWWQWCGDGEGDYVGRRLI
jgi:hypothetical protein